MTKLTHPFACLTVICLSFYATNAYAGAWLQAEGTGEAIVNAVYFSSDEFWDRSGDNQSQPHFDKLELNPYLEYGVSESLTLGGSLFLHALNQETTSAADRDNAGLGNSEWFARTSLLRGDDYAISLQPLIALPAAYEHDGAPRAGSDSFDAELSLLGGTNFSWFGRQHYADARLGYRHRLDDALEDQIRIDAKLGLSLCEEWQFIPALVSVWSLADNKNPIFTEDGQQDYDLVKIEAMLRYQLTSSSYVQGGGFSHVYGRNVGDGSGALVSFGHRF